MKFIDPTISFSTVKHPSERTLFELGFKKGRKRKCNLNEVQLFPYSSQNCQFYVCFNAGIGQMFMKF